MNYSLEEHLDPIITGEVLLPNFEPLDISEVGNAIAACGHGMLPKWGCANYQGRTRWAQYFLTGAGMGSPLNGCFDGGGYVIIYESTAPIVGTFAICKHEKKDAPGADHRRGWHPGACSKCGMDMTIDSGD